MTDKSRKNKILFETNFDRELTKITKSIEMWVKDALKREKENDKFTHYNDIHNFFISNYGQASAFKVIYIFKVFGAQSCLSVA